MLRGTRPAALAGQVRAHPCSNDTSSRRALEPPSRFQGAARAAFFAIVRAMPQAARLEPGNSQAARRLVTAKTVLSIRGMGSD
jgi:hypothetical protein